jgi:glycosyltransferase involved in cell wall biosynthesis
MQNPKVSFCFSTYKRASYLQSTLKSVQLQTFTNFEVIVSDNDPEQSGRTIVAEFDERFKYFPNNENLGMKKSFNKSLERSTGEYIVMIADDDPVYPDMLDTLFKLENKYPDYGMYMGGCDWLCIDPEVGKLYNFKVGTNSCLSNNHELGFIKSFSPGEFLIDLFNFRIFPHYLWSTCIVKRKILQNVGGVPEYGTPFLGDYAYMAAVGAQQGCIIINKSLGAQTLHNENFGRKQNEQIVVAAQNFPVYIKNKASSLHNWLEIEKLVTRFTALWIVSHMSFLHSYYRKLGQHDKDLRHAEKEVFRVNYMKKYRLKYFLKKNLPFIHNIIVKAKSYLIK